MHVFIWLTEIYFSIQEVTSVLINFNIDKFWVDVFQFYNHSNFQWFDFEDHQLKQIILHNSSTM